MKEISLGLRQALESGECVLFIGSGGSGTSYNPPVKRKVKFE